MQCEASITEEHMKQLQKYKEAPESFDSSQVGFTPLVRVSFVKYDDLGHDGTKPT